MEWDRDVVSCVPEWIKVTCNVEHFPHVTCSVIIEKLANVMPIITSMLSLIIVKEVEEG